MKAGMSVIIIKGKLEIQGPIEIDRCHRMGKHKRNRPRTIIFKLNKLKDEQKYSEMPET